MNKIISILVSCFLLASCATHITKPKSSPEPTKVRFSEFKRVEMKEAAIGAKFANGKANKRAAKKINEMLFEKMRMVLPNLHEIEQTQDFSNASARTLQITPRIKEIKFIGGAARFWGGIFSGSSAVLVQVEFRDSKSGAVIADPEFYRSANAFGGAWSMGHSDNKMLEEIANDIVQYTSYNK